MFSLDRKSEKYAYYYSGVFTRYLISFSLPSMANESPSLYGNVNFVITEWFTVMAA